MREKENKPAEEKKYFCKKLDKGFELQEPCIELLEKLEKLGYDFTDAAKINKAYLETTSKPDLLKELVEILFNEKLSDEDIKKISIKVVRNGLMDFLTDYGLLLT